MQKQLFIIIVAACIGYTMIVAGCAGQAEPTITGKPPAESGSVVILVENTSVSLQVRQIKSDMDRLMEVIHSTLNNRLEGKVR
jgi:hypothetical protein